MKRTKKLLAMALAVMMAFSCMAMPAMALEDGAARDRMFCTGCDKYQVFFHHEYGSYMDTFRTVGGCSKTNTSHIHMFHERNCVFECPGCHVQVQNHTHVSYEVCQYNG